MGLGMTRRMKLAQIGAGGLLGRKDGPLRTQTLRPCQPELDSVVFRIAVLRRHEDRRSDRHVAPVCIANRLRRRSLPTGFAGGAELAG